MRHGQAGNNFPAGVGGVRRGGCLLVLVGLPLLLWLLYSAYFPAWRWNQKLTVVVETPAGEVSGSSVTAVTYRRLPRIMPESGVRAISSRGEVPVADLGGGKYLFALSLRNEWFPINAFRSIEKFRNGNEDGLAQLAPTYSGGPFELTPNLYPLLVTFADIADPASVKRVDPYDLAASFGPGYALQSVTLEVTDEAVTQGRVEAVLGWLGEHPEPGLCPPTGKTSDIPFCRRVRHGDFIRRQQ